MNLTTWVARQWPALVGPQIAAVATPGRVATDGTLDVRVTSEAWAAELGSMTSPILAKLNARPGDRVTGIRWTPTPAEKGGNDGPQLLR